MRGYRHEEIRRIPCIREADTLKTLQRIAIDKEAIIPLNGKNGWINTHFTLKPLACQPYIILWTVTIVFHHYIPLWLPTYHSPTSCCPNVDVVQVTITRSCKINGSIT